MHWRSGLKPAYVLIGMLVADFIFFHAQILSGFSLLWSDAYDGGIEAAILEHWYNVARGYSSWSGPEYFFPADKAIGYNDGYLLYGLIHAVFRTIGFDVFVSSQLVDIIIKSIGFIAFFCFMRMAFSSQYICALFGAILFTVGHATFMNAFHQQLLSVSFAPLLACLLLGAYRALVADKPLSFASFGSVAALLYPAWLLTGYYMAWFFALFILFLMAFMMVFGAGRIGQAWPLLRRRKFICMLIATVFVLALIPFLSVYLPKARETRMHEWGAAFYFAPTFNDAVNVGPGNTLFGQSFNVICRWCTPGNNELIMGIPPILMFLFLCASVWVIGRYRGPDAVLLRATAAATVFSWLFIFRLGHYAFWKILFDLMPGARGVRVISRYQILLTVPVVGLTMMYLQHALSQAPRAIAVLLGILLVLEQTGAGPRLSSRAEELAHIAAPPPPPDCRAFYVTAARDQTTDSEVMRRYPHNVEAMLIAELTHLPTINGYSSFLPPGWDFEDPLRPDYLARVRRYADEHGVSGLCRLNLLTLTWSGPEI